VREGDRDLLARLVSAWLDGCSFERGRRMLGLGRDHYARLSMALVKGLIAGMDRRDRGRFVEDLLAWGREGYKEPTESGPHGLT
jgi:hypothetical protein